MGKRNDTRRRLRIGWTLAIVSLLLVIAWAVSTAYVVRWNVTQHLALWLSSGGVTILTFHDSPELMWFTRDGLTISGKEYAHSWWFHTYHDPAVPLITYFLPLWPFFLLTAIPSTFLLNSTRKRHPCCGYPREGLPPGSRCPECGAA